MAGDDELLPDDKDVFAAALSDEPPAEQPAEAEAEPKPEGEQPRDEHGRFAPKAADAETPEPAPLEPLKTEAQKPPPEEAIPSWRLREETQRRREAEERSQALEGQLRQYLQQQTRQQQQPQKPIPDIIEDPMGFRQAILEEVRQEREQFRQELAREAIQSSLWKADAKYGEEFQKAYITFDKSGSDHDLVRVRNSPDQGEAIMSWYRERETLREIGGDPKAYRQKLETEAEAKLLSDPVFRKKAMDQWRGEATTRPSNITSLPNLARAPGSSGNSMSDYPTDEAGIFQSVTAGLNRR